MLEANPPALASHGSTPLCLDLPYPCISKAGQAYLLAEKPSAAASMVEAKPRGVLVEATKQKQYRVPDYDQFLKTDPVGRRILDRAIATARKIAPNTLASKHSKAVSIGVSLSGLDNNWQHSFAIAQTSRWYHQLHHHDPFVEVRAERLNADEIRIYFTIEAKGPVGVSTRLYTGTIWETIGFYEHEPMTMKYKELPPPEKELKA